MMNKKPDKNFLRYSPLLIAVLAAACSHTPGPADIPPGADFTANILADGTKLFTFSTRLERGGGMFGGGSGRRGGGREEGEDGEEQRQRRSPVKPNQQGLQAMLAQNGYCRDGYVVLEQYEQHNQYVTRGECRDAATDADRERYKH